jgi:hypothetical protein
MSRQGWCPPHCIHGQEKGQSISRSVVRWKTVALRQFTHLPVASAECFGAASQVDHRARSITHDGVGIAPQAPEMFVLGDVYTLKVK